LPNVAVLVPLPIALAPITISLLVIILFALATGIFFSMKKSVSIYYDGNNVTLKTMKSTVNDALIQAGINVSYNDYISVPLDSKLQRRNVNNIYIKFAVPVNIVVDEQKIALMTYKETVGDILQSQVMQGSTIVLNKT